MRKLKVRKIWISAFLLPVLVLGCGDPDKNAGGLGGPLAPPTVTFVTPPNGSTVVCPNNAIITATFSKDMNPATINSPATTFTVTGPGGVNVAGTVNYVVATRIATFTASAPLASSTPFTATISTGAADTFGNQLAANFVWTFTTSGPCAAPGGIALGTACSFGILGATPSVTNTGPTHVTGDVGISPAASITGFTGILPGGPGTITGTFHAGDATAASAQTDLTTAFNNAMNAGGGPGVGTVLSADIGGQTLVPGIYTTTSGQPTLAITGDLHLSGNGVYIFKVQTALTTADGSVSVPASRVLLSGGAVAHDVFWQIGSAATLGTFSTFQGTIMANATITLKTGATLNGRALDRSAAVTLDSNPVNVPPCP
jgi:hypothetical protein